MESDALLGEITGINNSLADIVCLLKNKKDNQSIHEHRIGALNRISRAIEYMKEVQKHICIERDALEVIKQILLGND